MLTISMKIRIQIVLYASVLFVAPVLCQNTDSILVTGNFRNTSMIDFLGQIEAAYPINFYYDPKWFKNLSFDQTFLNAPMTSVIDMITKETPYLSISLNNAYVFMPRDRAGIIANKQEGSSNGMTEPAILIGKANESGKYKNAVVRGCVTDGKNGDPLIGATLQILNSGYATVSDREGNYVFVVPVGIDDLKIT